MPDAYERDLELELARLREENARLRASLDSARAHRCRSAPALVVLKAAAA